MAVMVDTPAGQCSILRIVDSPWLVSPVASEVEWASEAPNIVLGDVLSYEGPCNEWRRRALDDRPHGLGGAPPVMSATGSPSLRCERFYDLLDGEVVVETATGFVRLRFGDSVVTPEQQGC